MTPDEQAALDKWAEIAAERATIEEFLDWAPFNGARLVPDDGHTNRSDLLDKFYGINRGDLERARRALLSSVRKESSK